MKDWIIRAIKTFVQAFFGVLVPEVVFVLNHIGDYDSMKGAWVYLAPVIAAALAAAISAVWNYILEQQSK